VFVAGVVASVCRSRASLCVCVPTELASVSWRRAGTVPPIDSWCRHAICSHVTAREAELVYVTRLCFCIF
jgi:hypothetical protein